MNQYIITEEELAEMVCDFYNGFFSAGSDIATTVRSHPYQSERDKVLDEMIRRIEFRFEDTNQGRGVVGVMREMINKYKEELRRAGEL